MIFKTRLKTFSAQAVELLLTALDEDDRIGDASGLPATLAAPCTQATIEDNYALCLQLWEQGFSRRELRALVRKVLRGATLTEAEGMRYKSIRARFKHLRFAQRLYRRQHDSTRLFKLITVFLGHFQDGFRYGNDQTLRLYGTLLTVLLSRPLWALMRCTLRHTRLDNLPGFMRHCQQQMYELRVLSSKPQLTGTEFHDVRKIISQQVSYYDTLRSLYPADRQAYQTSRFLANINGLMGQRHDGMVADKLAGRRHYDTPDALDAAISQQLRLLTEHASQGLVPV